MVPPAWGVWIALGLVVALPGFLGDGVRLAFLASVALYAAVILAGSAWLGRGAPLAVGVRLPAVFAAIHLGFAWGFRARGGAGGAIGLP